MIRHLDPTAASARSTRLAYLLVALFVFAPTPGQMAHAQIAEDESEDDELGLPDVGPPIREMTPAGLKRHDLYWADKRKVDAIQKRDFLKDGRHEFTLHTGVIPNDEFYTYVAMGLRYSYFFAEDIGMEIWGTYEHALKTDFEELLEQRAEDLLKVEVPQSVMLGRSQRGVEPNPRQIRDVRIYARPLRRLSLHGSRVHPDADSRLGRHRGGP